MNDLDAANTLGLLTAAWPNHDMPDRTTDLWIGMLCELHIDDAKAAARAVIREDNWFPSIARFIACVDAANHARRNREAAARGLPSPGVRTPDRERFNEIVGRLRSQLADRGTGRHWHGGPDRCPICGANPRPALRRPPGATP